MYPNGVLPDIGGLIKLWLTKNELGVSYFHVTSTLATYLTRLIVHVAIGKHCVKILNAFLGTVVIITLQPLLYGSKIHWMLDNVVIILNKNKK